MTFSQSDSERMKLFPLAVTSQIGIRGYRALKGIDRPFGRGRE
jgi:hypothetical protein